MTAEGDVVLETGLGDPQGFAGLYVESVRIRNFRGLTDCTVDFERDLTVLVGRNNSGKSRVLRALAVGLGAATPDRDDLTVLGPVAAAVDIVLAPTAAQGAEDAFDDRVARRLGSVQPIAESPVQERFAWRTSIKASSEGFGVRGETSVLMWDPTSRGWVQPSQPTSLGSDQRNLVAADLVETRRDLVEELTRRGSPIRRILDDLEIAGERRQELEDSLAGLGQQIVDSSESLGAVRGALLALAAAIDTMGVANLRPLPVRLEELARSVSIELDAGEGGLPMRLHGAGARSMASLQVQSVLYDRRLGRDGPALRPHPVSLIEEPEAHLHPQAQFELPTLLGEIRGQVIVTTHSTHLVSVVEPRSVRVVQRSGSETTLVDLRPTDEQSPDRARRPSMHLEEMERIRRLIERPFGELLFASAVILGDGATERALLPPLIRRALGHRAHGVCVVDPGSMNSPHANATIKFANLLGYPWLLFSDSDEPGSLAALRLVKSLGSGDETRIIWVPGPPSAATQGSATERMFLEFDPSLCLDACTELGYLGEHDGVLAFMEKHKGAMGRLLASHLMARHPWQGQGAPTQCWPTAIHALLTKLDELLTTRVSAL
ncbi:MAG TPA: AAA family ATPase [Actinomycetota bacterium]|nr:AAA family ATPase [Actinomycetota bacterium]